MSANVGSKDPIADTLRIARAFFAAEPPPLPASENKKPAAEPKKKAVKEMSEDEINDELARGAKPHPSQTAKPRKTAKPDPEPETGEDTTYKSGEDDPW